MHSSSFFLPVWKLSLYFVCPNWPVLLFIFFFVLICWKTHFSFVSLPLPISKSFLSRAILALWKNHLSFASPAQQIGKIFAHHSARLSAGLEADLGPCRPLISNKNWRSWTALYLNPIWSARRWKILPRVKWGKIGILKTRGIGSFSFQWGVKINLIVYVFYMTDLENEKNSLGLRSLPIDCNLHLLNSFSF